MADITRTDEGGEGYREGREIREFKYIDAGAGGVEDVLIAPGGLGGDIGIYIPHQTSTRLVCSLRNNSRDAIAWAKAPVWKGTNDPNIKMPAPTNGFRLLIGSGNTVDQAFGAAMAADEEQGCVIDCSQVPRGIFLVISPIEENFNVSLLIRPHNKA